MSFIAKPKLKVLTKIFRVQIFLSSIIKLSKIKFAQSNLPCVCVVVDVPTNLSLLSHAVTMAKCTGCGRRSYSEGILTKLDGKFA